MYLIREEGIKMKRNLIIVTAVLTFASLLFVGCAPYDEISLTPEQMTPGPAISQEQPTPSPASSPEQITPGSASSPEQTTDSPATKTAPTTQQASTNPSTGTIQVLVTDAPNHDVSRVELTVSEVEVHKVGVDGESGNWTTLDIQEETFNLLDLQNGLTMLLADGEVEAGKYTQLRMTVFEVIVDYDDVMGKQAEVPSGEMKFVRPFTLEAGDNITLIVDIDAAKSVIVTGGTKQDKGKVLFKPVVKLQVVQGQEPDTQAPTVETYSPTDNATGVAQNANLVLTFDDDMVKGTGNITIMRYSDATVFETIDVTSVNVTISGTVVTIDPSGTFDSGTGYYVLIDATALADDNGNGYAGISNKETWNFTT
jgi:hypothetical protein